jgi:hypothetical protein
LAGASSLVLFGKPDTSPMVMEPANLSFSRYDKSIQQGTALEQLRPSPPDAIELTGLELLGIGLGLEGDLDDDESCESYCADSVPCALRTSTTKESTKVAMKSCLRLSATSRAMPRIILRRGSLASQLTDEEEDDEASEASLDSSESSHSIDLPLYANNRVQQHRVPSSSNQQNKTRSHWQRLHSSATAPLHGSGYLMDDVSDSHFVDFANDSVHLVASTTHKHHAAAAAAALRTFAPAIAPPSPARQPQSEMGRAA